MKQGDDACGCVRPSAHNIEALVEESGKTWQLLFNKICLFVFDQWVFAANAACSGRLAFDSLHGRALSLERTGYWALEVYQ